MNRVSNFSRGNRLNVYQEFKPITIIGKFLGVFSLKIGNIFGNQVFMTSRTASIYSIVLLVLTFVHLIYVPSMTISTSNFVNGNKSRNYSTENLKNPLATPPLLMRLLNGFAMSLMAISSRINAISCVRKNLPNLFDTLESIDGLLSPTIKKRRKNIRAIFILVGLSVLVGLPGQIFSSIFVYKARSYYIGIYMLGNNVNNFTSVSVEAQFMALCYLLKSRFETINEKLLYVKNLYNIEDRFSVSQRNRKFSNRKKVNSDIKFIAGAKTEILIHGNSRSENAEDAANCQTSISETIKISRIAHQRLCDVLDQVNDTYQIQLLVSISACFLNELFNMYSVFSGGAWKMLKSSNFNANTTVLTHPLINLSWAIYYAIRIIAMATVASKTTNAAKRALIHILEARRTSMNSIVKEELVIFYDHVNSRKVQFSAAGLFNLNVALISSVVTTGSTYLVMMVQIHDR